MGNNLSIYYNSLEKNIQNYALKMNIFGATGLIPDNIYAALALMSAYDTDNNKISAYNIKKQPNHYNGTIDEEEFTDTEEEYNNRIRLIKHAASLKGRDLSNISFPSYKEMEIYSRYFGYEFRDLSKYMGTSPKTINEEIGFGFMDYYELGYGGSIERRQYDNGTIVEISCDYAGNLRQLHYDNGKSQVHKYYNGRSKELINVNVVGTLENLNEHHYEDKVINLAQDFRKEIYKKNFLGLPQRSDNLENLMKQVRDSEIAYDVFRCYKDLTGNSLLDDIKNERGQKNRENMYIDLQHYMAHYYKAGWPIENFSEFIADCNLQYILDDLDNISSYPEEEIPQHIDDIIKNWKNITGRNSFVRDIESSNLPEDKKRKYKSLFMIHATDVSGGYKPLLKIDDSTVQNDYHTGDSYSVTFRDNMIFIKNKNTNRESTINMDVLLRDMTDYDRLQMMAALQKLPGEVLEDISIELNFMLSKSDKIGKGTTDGFFDVFKDGVTVNINDLTTIVHEIGHAVDYGANHVSRSSLNEFSSVFKEELSAYLSQGERQYGNGCSSNYATKNEQEMFAECYTLLMLGDTMCKDCIITYFPKCLKAAENMLKEIRQQNNSSRNSNY